LFQNQLVQKSALSYDLYPYSVSHSNELVVPNQFEAVVRIVWLQANDIGYLLYEWFCCPLLVPTLGYTLFAKHNCATMAKLQT